MMFKTSFDSSSGSVWQDASAVAMTRIVNYANLNLDPENLMPIIQSNETTDQHAYSDTTVENDLSESGYEAMHSEHASFSSTTTPLFVLEEPVFDSFLIDEGSISSLSSWSSVEVLT